MRFYKNHDSGMVDIFNSEPDQVMTQEQFAAWQEQQKQEKRIVELREAIQKATQELNALLGQPTLVRDEVQGQVALSGDQGASPVPFRKKW